MNSSRFAHHMLREIGEEPKVVEATLKQSRKAVARIAEEVKSKDYRLVYITGSGTSYHAGLACQYVMFHFGTALTSLIPASEFPFWVPSTIDRKALLMAISQSGESADALKAADTALDRGMDILAVTNTKGSTLARKAQYTLLTRAGKELAVTATKSYIAQLTILYLFALESAERGGTSGDLTVLRQRLFETPRLISEVLESYNDTMLRLAEDHKDKSLFFALGSGPNYATALETALKMKEACNIFAEGFASREFLHGPIQLVNEKTPVIFIMSSDEVEDLMSLLRSVRRFNAPIISVSDDKEELRDISSETISVPKSLPTIFSPILYIVPIQLFAYYSSVSRGLNPDKPEKLTKVVK